MIKILEFYLALIIARCAYMGIRLLNKSSGTSFVGMLTLKICPDFLAHCSKYVRKKIVTVTGTNGKSTTSGLVAHILEKANQKVIHNCLRFLSNLLKDMITQLLNLMKHTLLNYMTI